MQPVNASPAKPNMPDKAAESILVFAYGNPSRGDDALGPLLAEKLENCCQQPEVKFVCDFQLQIEHATDLHECERVLLIDAAASLQQPCQFYRVLEQTQTQYTTHGMTPGQLLSVYRQVYQQPAPATFMLALRGTRFNLGEPLSSVAKISLQSGFELAQALLAAHSTQVWDKLTHQAE